MTHIVYTAKEIIWLKAANTLPRTERMEAIRDIAAMGGKWPSEVFLKAERLRNEAREDARAILTTVAQPRRVMTAKMPLSVFPASKLSPPSKAQLMRGR